MDEATAKQLREPFPAELVGKLPRVWCSACRDARSKVCTDHRNAAMRYGVGLDLWRKEPPPTGEVSTERPARRPRQATASSSHLEPDVEKLKRQQWPLWKEVGYDGDENRDNRLRALSKILGRDVTSSNDVTDDEWPSVIAALKDRKRQLAEQAGGQP